MSVDTTTAHQATVPNPQDLNPTSDLHAIGNAKFNDGNYEESAAIWRQLIQASHPSRPDLSALFNLASTLATQGEYDQSEVLLYALTPLLQSRVGEASPQALGCIRKLSECAYKIGRFDRADELLKYGSGLVRGINDESVQREEECALKEQAARQKETGQSG